MLLLDPAGSPGPASAPPRRIRLGLLRRRGVREVLLVAALYVGYSLSRLLADEAFAPARDRALTLLRVERRLGLDVEAGLNGWFLDHDPAGVLASFQYATAHYVLTAVVLVWLWRRGAAVYGPARSALALATVLGLLAYLLVPTAPPRFVEGYADLLEVHAAAGWWGADASAPRGLGQLTNQLAAFPSLHAGWALWVALAVGRVSGSRVVRSLAWGHCLVTAVVVVGTGNHWTLDVVGGWAVVALAWWLTTPGGRQTESPRPVVSEHSLT